MFIQRESTTPLGFFNYHTTNSLPQHLVDTFVEDLQIGEYRIKYRIRPVIFLRIYNWREELTILHFNPYESGSIILSDYREIILSDNDLHYHFDDIVSCRVILIGDEGYSSFRVNFTG